MKKKLDQLLTAQEYGQLVKAGKKYFGLTNVTLTGGEPLLRSDLLDIIQVIKKEVVHVTVVTNGSLLDKNIDSIKLVDELHVSFHSFDQNEWSRITRSGTKVMNQVQQNIINTRKHYPDLMIKLNIVSEKGNNSKNSIRQYLKFAQENNLILSVFQESYIRWAKTMNMHVEIDIEAEPWWDITPFTPVLINRQRRKDVFKIENVIVALCYTSVEKPDMESIWIDPYGYAYMDIYKKSQSVNLKQIVISNDKNIIRLKEILIA